MNPVRNSLNSICVISKLKLRGNFICQLIKHFYGNF